LTPSWPPLVFTRRFPLIALLVVLPGAAAAQGNWPLKLWPRRELRATLATLQGETLPAESIRLKTPPDLASPPPGGSLYDWRAEPGNPAFETLRAILVQTETVEWLSSGAGELECFRLGPVGGASPPPPDWRRSFGQPAWTKAAAVEGSATLPYLNRAQFCWVDPKQPNLEAQGEFLFRQRLRSRSPGLISRAILRVGGRIDFLSLSLNDRPIHLAGQADFRLGEFDVTPLVRDDENLVAVWVRTRPESLIEQPALAFQLEIWRVATPGRRASEGWTSRAILISTGGGRLLGEPSIMSQERIIFQTRYGTWALPWEGARGLLFPLSMMGETPEVKKENAWQIALGRFWPGRPSGPLEPQGYGLPLKLLPEALPGTVLLSGGRTTRTHPTFFAKGRLHLVSRTGESYSVGGSEVVGIYPPEPAEALIRRPSSDVALLYGRLRTARGETVSGVIRQLDGRGAVLETPAGDFLKLPTEAIVKVTFPYHGLAGPAARAPAALAAAGEPQKGQVGLLGQAEGAPPAARADYLALASQVQEAAFLAGLECVQPTQAELTDAEGFLPARYPVLVIVDPLGEYPETLGQEGDAQAALHAHVRSGGALLLYSRGGALRTAVRSHQGRFLRSPAEGGLARLLSLETLHPAGRLPSGEAPFDRPPNLALALQFQRAGGLPDPLLGLPETIDLPALAAAPFYPMVEALRRGSVIYQLRDDSGRRYGPGLSVIPAVGGKVIIIDHLLWHSVVDEEPFTRIVLPRILSWAALEALRGRPGA